MPRGAYAPRSWSGMRALGELCVFQLQIRPEHRCVRERAHHTCVFHLRIRYVHHGGLTPPAPGCTTFVRCEKRHSRCKNARLQERRASARRGFPNRICKCNAMNFGVRVSRPEYIPRGAYAPAPGCTVPLRRRKRQPQYTSNFSAKNDIRGAQTHVRKSGGREPAVGIANASAVVLVCHGRLTPTALVSRCERLSAKNNFCDEQTHVHKSGGRQPAVVFRTAYAGAMR
jgi:hypothetical protein